jgi:hypothetical protein
MNQLARAITCCAGIACAMSSSVLAQGTLYAIDSSRAISTIDMATGAKTLIGTADAAAGTTGGLARNNVTGEIYLTSTSLDSLFTLDLTTGAVTLIGAYGDSAIVMHGLEWDSSTNTLYGESSHNGGLYTINITTGAATLVGTSGITSFTNLGYNSATNVMYATNSGAPERLFSVNLGTGALTEIGLIAPSTNPNGLAYNSANGLLYLVDNTTDVLYTLDMATGAPTTIGSTDTGNLLGLVYVPDEPQDCPGNTNGDGNVDVTDLLAVIGAWGPCSTCPAQGCAADVAPNPPDCQINVTDLLAVIGAWGPCP